MLCEQMQPHDNVIYIREKAKHQWAFLNPLKNLCFEECKPGEVVCTIASYDKFVKYGWDIVRFYE